MRKIQKLEKELESNIQEIEKLNSFRPDKFVNQLKRKLFEEQSNIKHQMKKLQETIQEKLVSQKERKIKANQNRSKKMSRSWNYFRAIQKNWFPDMSTKEIRSAFTKSKQGIETEISEITWRNPSP
jgi:hypothetical protein